MAKIYWDTNLFIYLFEDNPRFVPVVKSLRSRMVARGDRLYTSALSVGEILVKPAEMGRGDLVERYRSFFRGSAVTVIPFDIDASELYAVIRRDRSIRPPDAAHLACAASAGIDLFITNDDRLSRKVISGISFLCALGQAPL
ncbi:MAG TPA: PIN domain-containing protein [Bryobacteraceae bacterium]|nr:PIN domain-containing protein [Bryobacteraceae bacterium]